MSKRYEVQGPFKRRGKPQYWVLFDRLEKRLVSTHPRSGEAWNKMQRLQEATKDGDSAKTHL